MRLKLNYNAPEIVIISYTLSSVGRSELLLHVRAFLKKGLSLKDAANTISLDGEYAHRRNPSMCYAAFINHENNKIVAGSVVTKTCKGGDFSGSSNMLDSECIKRNLSQIQINKVKKFCHDRDK